MGETPDASAYRFVANGPTQLVDPLGLIAWGVLWRAQSVVGDVLGWGQLVANLSQQGTPLKIAHGNALTIQFTTKDIEASGSIRRMLGQFDPASLDVGGVGVNVRIATKFDIQNYPDWLSDLFDSDDSGGLMGVQYINKVKPLQASLPKPYEFAHSPHHVVTGTKATILCAGNSIMLRWTDEAGRSNPDSALDYVWASYYWGSEFKIQMRYRVWTNLGVHDALLGPRGHGVESLEWGEPIHIQCCDP